MQPQNITTDPVTTPVTNAPKSAPDIKPILDIFLDWAFRLGLGSVCIINSLTALIQPDGFRKLIEHNFIAQSVGHYQLQLYIIAVNDMLLGLILLSGFKKKYVYAWAGMWLAIVTFFKITSL
jgi:hypothetical protein